MGRSEVNMLPRWSWAFAFIGILAFSVVPIAFSVRYLNLFSEILILGLFAMSLNIVMGYTGMVSFAQAMFFGIGAYASGMILIKFNLPLPFATINGALVSTIIAVPVGFFCTRATRIYFGMLTLAFAQLIYAVVYKWYSFTGGSDGIAGIPRSTLWFGIADLSSRVAYYYFVFIVTTLSLLVFIQIIKSPFGKVLYAIKENEKKVESLGINTRIFKSISFVISAFFAGIAGSLFASFHGFASPELLFLDYSGNCLLMLILGGVGTILGPFVGAIIFVLLHEELSLFTENYLIFVGIIFILAVLFFPDGLVGFLSALRKRKE
jgi:branched-chain amino acid transport system permease protein